MVTELEVCEEFESLGAPPEHAVVSLVGVENLHLVKEDMEVSRFGVKARSRCKYALNFLKVSNSCVDLETNPLLNLALSICSTS